MDVGAHHDVIGTSIPEDKPAEDLAVTLVPRIDKARKRKLFTVAPLILGNELCERLAYYGMATNLINYITGVLRVDNASASSQLNIWTGTCYITPLLGAFVADAYLGRFWTIFSLNIVYMLGLVLLTLSAALPALSPAPGQSPTGMQMGVFWLAMYLIALGTGGIKPNVASFGADQFREDCPAEVAARSRFYNYFYFFINVGSLVAALALVPVQESVGWVVGFAIPAGAFAVALLLFASGMKAYTYKRPTGSSMGRVFDTGFAAFMKRKTPLPENPKELYEVPGPASAIKGSRKIAHSNKLKCLDHAAVITTPLLPETATAGYKQGASSSATAAGASSKDAAAAAAAAAAAGTDVDGAVIIKERGDRWLRSVTHCEEAKIVILLLPLLLPNLIFQVIYNQMGTLFVLQGDTMDRSFGRFQVPSASVSFIDTVAVMVTCVVYDSVIAPWWAKRGKPLCPLRRIGWGYVFSALSMICAAVVEMARLKKVAALGLQNAAYLQGEIVPISVWWLVPQYAFIGIAEVYANVGLMELYYSVAPDSSKSYAQALTLITTGISGYISSALVVGVQAATSKNGAPGWIADNLNVAHLDYFYWLLAAIQVVDIFLHIPIARAFDTRNPHEGADALEPLAAAGPRQLSLNKIRRSLSAGRGGSGSAAGSATAGSPNNWRLDSLILYRQAASAGKAHRAALAAAAAQEQQQEPRVSSYAEVAVATGYLSSFSSSLGRPSAPRTEAVPVAPLQPVVLASPAAAAAAARSEGSATSRKSSVGAMDIMLRH